MMKIGKGIVMTNDARRVSEGACDMHRQIFSEESTQVFDSLIVIASITSSPNKKNSLAESG